MLVMLTLLACGANCAQCCQSIRVGFSRGNASSWVKMGCNARGWGCSTHTWASQPLGRRNTRAGTSLSACLHSNPLVTGCVALHHSMSAHCEIYCYCCHRLCRLGARHLGGAGPRRAGVQTVQRTGEPRSPGHAGMRHQPTLGQGQRQAQGQASHLASSRVSRGRAVHRFQREGGLMDAGCT